MMKTLTCLLGGLAVLVDVVEGSCAASDGYYVVRGTFVSQSDVSSYEKCCVVCGAAVGSNNRGDWQSTSSLCNCYEGGTSSGTDSSYTAVSFSNVDDSWCEDGVNINGITCAQNIVTNNYRSGPGCMQWCQEQVTCQHATNKLVGSSFSTQSNDCRCTRRGNNPVTGNNDNTKVGCAKTYVNYELVEEEMPVSASSQTTGLQLQQSLQDLCDLHGFSQARLQSTSYSFLVTISDDFVQSYLEEYNVCITRGVVTPATLTPVWVSTYMASQMPFSYEVQYGAYWADTVYQAGMTVLPSTNWDVSLGDCYYIGNRGQRDPCQESNSKGLVLKNTGDNDITVGMYSSMTSPTSNVPAASLNPFYAKKILAKSGWVLIEPLQTLTIGLCDYAEGQLVRAQAFAGEYTWTVSTDGSDVIEWNMATNSFQSAS